jgi:hypothetical protein
VLRKLAATEMHKMQRSIWRTCRTPGRPKQACMIQPSSPLPIQPIIQARLEGLSIIPARGKIKNTRTFAMSGYGERGRLIPLTLDDLKGRIG